MLDNIFNNKKIVFIAEIGLNHNGDPALAEEMIVKAAEAGADAVKFQTFIPEKMVSPYSSSLLKNGEENNPDYSIIDFFSKFTFTAGQWKKLKKVAEKCRTEFFSAPFDAESVEFLESMDVRLYKVASSEVTNTPLIRKIGATKKPVLLSTGMSSERDIELSLKNLKESGNPETVLLHCVSIYPAKNDEVNLKRIVSLRDRFGIPVGLSDHTGGYESAVIAAALGAAVIEKHFIIDENHDCPDKEVSLTADCFKKMTVKVNETLSMTGDGRIQYSGREANTALAARRSLFAAKKITAGEILTGNSIIALRPGTGISPDRIDEITGKKSKIDINEGSLLKWEYFE
ncbi:MAG TPA: N-acetylneuraminate synthase family protein [Spirochaetota bacterium]|nr:N-acetylneuraminate synthase family protein [Spirochaetota bacterium]HPS86118.1 N-acetylneuraminate synthase family protein [Spirochaetota bacterium]